MDFRSVTRDDLGRNWAVDLPKKQESNITAMFVGS